MRKPYTDERYDPLWRLRREPRKSRMHYFIKRFSRDDNEFFEEIYPYDVFYDALDIITIAWKVYLERKDDD